MILAKRKFLTGFASLLAAPAVVKVENLMRVFTIPLELVYDCYGNGYEAYTSYFTMQPLISED